MTSPAWAGAAAIKPAAAASAMVRVIRRITGTTTCSRRVAVCATGPTILPRDASPAFAAATGHLPAGRVRRRRRQRQRRGAARPRFLAGDPQRRSRLGGRDRPERRAGRADPDRGGGAVSQQREQAPGGGHRAEDRVRRRRPDGHERCAHDRRPRLREVPGRLLRAAARARARGQPGDQAKQQESRRQATRRARPRPALLARRVESRRTTPKWRGSRPATCRARSTWRA